MVTEYHYILTLAWNRGSANAQSTQSGVFTPDGNSTRDAAFLHIYQNARTSMGIQMENPTVLFFSLEPNIVL